MIIDDIFHKKERDYSELQQVEKQLTKIAFIIWGITLLCWLVVGFLDPEEDLELLIGVTIIFTIFPPLIGTIFAFPVALIPYKDFNYRERLPRAWLLVMIVLLSALLALGLFALMMENFNII